MSETALVDVLSAVHSTRLDCVSDPPMKQMESARLSRRPRRELTLEESWTSLSVFNQTQKGRISLDLQGQSRNSVVGLIFVKFCDQLQQQLITVNSWEF